ncbi:MULTISPECIES: DUF6194 family protein [Rhodococcus]|uniref:DUF6194 family protein n=1 Tax=Rhodococcus TaxID=1827 RepID=UPI0005730CF6|nr:MULTISPECIES: DUF6194 family protein [Rhodococcus]KHJ72918.1 hypothetical protein QR64_09095 [Rhodococcus sp. Chr-9]MBX4169901.1 hypothetical protein [Rhodococcus sp. DMU2021]QXF82784.1 hypothetical protein HBA53_18565 [Rhodococcus pyridinivorans]
MTMEQILAQIRSFSGVLELAPQDGSGLPEISWGDHFFYYAPDGEIPHKRQPYATIVTKNYPNDGDSRLDEPGRWRMNVHAGTQLFTELLGYPPRSVDPSTIDFAEADVFIPHPLYGSLGWVAVVEPGERTTPRLLEVLRDAHLADRRRLECRSALRDTE